MSEAVDAGTGERVDLDTGTETVRAWIEDQVGVIRFNRPERRNALHPDMYWAVPDVVRRFDADDRVRCILVTAEGTAFCAGGDVVGGVNRNQAEGAAPVEEKPHPPIDPDLSIGAMVVLLHESPKVSIAALPGPAVGAGVGVALCTDLRIVAESAKLIPGWGNLAFSGDFGGTYFLSRMLGPTRALDLMIENATLTAQQGHDLGLFNRVVPDADLDAAAMAWAAKIAAGPAQTWDYMKQNVWEAQRMTLREFLPRESRRMALSGQTEDHRDAVRRWLRAAKEKAATKAAHAQPPS
jgi:2-(1,2-epoxy-1,2-dihydrophenyl)acetyl-CoA isomerase